MPKFKGSYKVVATDSGNKFKIRHLETGNISVSHADELKNTNINEFDEHTPIHSEETDNTETRADEAQTKIDSAQTGTSNTASENKSHAYRTKLRSHRKRVLPLNCVNETSLETEFYKYVDEILDELHIDCYSFYK